ncbi:MAG: hypothetical protein MJK18_14795 [Bdellovibrionales bacterium]|nr:hypothetical protein [Bdellovibrionales bacterium]
MKKLGSLILATFLLSAPCFAQSQHSLALKYIKSSDVMTGCKDTNTDKVRLVSRRWTCSVSKYRLTHSRNMLLRYTKLLDKTKNKKSSKANYYNEKLDHYKDIFDEADRQLTEKNCANGCYK